MSSISITTNPPTSENNNLPPADDQALTSSPELCDDVLIHIFSFMTPEQMAESGKVCRNWRLVSSIDFLWRPYFIKEFGGVTGRDEPMMITYARCKSKSTEWSLDKKMETGPKIEAMVRHRQILIFSREDKSLTLDRNVYANENNEVQVKDISKITQMILEGSHLITAGWDNTIQIRDAETGTVKRELEEHKDWISSIDYNGRELISVSDDGELCVWNLLYKTLVKKFKVGEGDISALARCGDRIVVSSRLGSTLHVTHLDTGRGFKLEPSDHSYVLPEEDLDHQAEGNVVLLLPHGEQLLSVHDDGVLYLWDLENKRVLLAKKTESPIQSMSLAGECLVTGHFDGSITFWNINTFKEREKIKVSEHPISDVTREGDEFTAVDREGKISLFSLKDATNHPVKLGKSELPDGNY